MYEAGVLDFLILAEEEIFAWMRRKSFWPASMPESLDLVVLGLDEADVQKAKEKAREVIEQAQLEKRSIEIDGRRVAASGEDADELLSMVEASLEDGDSFLETRPEISDLEDFTRKGRGKQTTGKKTKRIPPKERLTDEQKYIIGLFGEKLASIWLAKHYDSYNDGCWKSGYRKAVFGDSGDDMLGYDFSVTDEKGKSVFFEVKASASDNLAFELGSTEVRAAQKYARINRYRILFIENVLDSGERKIHVLPNPFSTRGQKLLKNIGSGLKFTFQIVNRDSH